MEKERKTVEQIGKEKLAEISQAKEAKAAEAKAAQEKKDAEARGAAAASSAEKEKTKEEIAAQEQKDKEAKAKEAVDKAEAQEKEDARILETPDEKLSEKELSWKKEKAKQDKIDKRMGELTGEIKDLKKNDAGKTDKILALEKELAELKKPASERSAAKEVEEFKKAEAAQLAKYLEEDKDKPREERREMSKEELNDWLVEDYTAAQEWLTDRSIRRNNERSAVKAEKAIRAKAQDLLSKQAVHAKKAQEAHPELNTDAREAELAKEGKKPGEVHAILCKENEKYRICTEILRENPEKYLLSEDAPALVVAEMEKRLKGKKPAVKKVNADETQEERDARIREEGAAAERQRQEDLDEGINSSREKEGKEDKRSNFEKRQEKIAKTAGISPARLAELKKRREGIPGASIFKDDEDNT